ncbi:unnamed protein product, partial [Musa banksii]
MLIGPNSPISLESLYGGTHMAHVCDFCKPKLASEYLVLLMGKYHKHAISWDF